MFTKRRTCPESSRRCLTMAGNRCSISPSKSGSVAEEHSIVCTPSVNRRNAVGISTVIFISILVSCDRDEAVIDERLKFRQARSNRRRQCVFLRYGVNGFQSVAGDAGDGGLGGIDISLFEQFL